jgi:hypothetical protein
MIIVLIIICLLCIYVYLCVNILDTKLSDEKIQKT